jgi:chemotaxis signal transduction protein
MAMRRVNETLLRDQLLRLERELLLIRSEIAQTHKPLPPTPFTCLEIIVADLYFLLPIGVIQEVLPMLWCQPIPEASPWILGDFVYGQESVAAIDLRRRLGLGEPRISPSDILVVLESDGRLLSFAADGIGDLVHVDPASVMPTPKGIAHSAFLQGSIRSSAGTSLLLSVERLARESILEGPDVQPTA